MALNGILETEVEIKGDADKFYKIFSDQIHHIPNICSDKIHAVHLHEGDWETSGSVEAVAPRAKETIEEVDDESKTIKFNVLDGEMKKLYESFKATVQAMPKEKGGSLVEWTIEFEMQNEDAPNPDAYIDLAVKMTKDVDDHIVKPRSFN